MKSLFTNCIISSLFLLIFQQAQAQYTYMPKDTCIRTWGFIGHGGVDIPGGDLLNRFGPNGNAGTSMFYKTNKNFVFTFDWSYIFGGTIRENGILDSIKTSDGHVIDKEGKYADIRIFERGFTLSISAAKVLSFPPAMVKNKNSGVILGVGVGYLQHRIRIQDNGGRSPQLTREYLKGYDRLTSGLAANEFVGYWYMSRSRFVNLYFGLEFTEGFTRSRRSWDYDLMSADTKQRIDILSGVRVGWIIPFYKREANTYHYY